MKVIAKTENSDIATVYIAKYPDGKLIEFVESTQPPIPLEKKWVLIVSTLFGCPVACKFCDSGWKYEGKISKEQLFEQIDYMIARRYPDRSIPIDKFKIQFARMGEPSLNDAVLDVLEEFHQRYNAPGFLPSISTIAPIGRDMFFERLKDIKKRIYKDKFQMQFSIHTTDLTLRDELIPIKKWGFDKIARYSEDFFQDGDRKITLNFALGEGYKLEASKLIRYFDPKKFVIKLTPINPTGKAQQNNLNSVRFSDVQFFEIVKDLKLNDYEVILSIGELEENKIGSNCGQYISNYLKECPKLEDAYTYKLNDL